MGLQSITGYFYSLTIFIYTAVGERNVTDKTYSSHTFNCSKNGIFLQGKNPSKTNCYNVIIVLNYAREKWQS